MTDRARIIAELIADELALTEEGHCARVDYLVRQESVATCRALRDLSNRGASDLGAFVLRGTHDENGYDPEGVLIAAEQAIERRNRKGERLCLFVPADIIDAAASSLGNSFAPLDGRALHQAALARLLATLDSGLANVVQRSFGRLRGRLMVGDTERLDFLEAAIARVEQGEANRIGLELWRLGLLPDAGDDFLENLEKNGRLMLELSRPARLQAPLRDRIRKLNVDTTTAAALLEFLDGRALHDARAWARDLADTPWTLSAIK